MSAVVTAVSDVEVARSVLSTEAAGLHALAASLDRSFGRAVDRLAACPGRIVASGMGKSGHVARKVAATLASTGSPAIFVHPAEASHGDLGMVQPGDALLLFSNSGETTELADLVAHSRRFGLPLIAVTGRAASTLAAAADVTLLLPAAPEACAVTSAPTTSTTMQMALGDALAVALLTRRGFTASDFRTYHPGGRLGAQLRRVRDLMHKSDAMPLAGPGMPMQQALLLMTGKGFGCVGVTEAGRLIGIVTDGDLRRAMGPGLLDLPVRAVMTAAPRTISPRRPCRGRVARDERRRPAHHQPVRRGRRGVAAWHPACPRLVARGCGLTVAPLPRPRIDRLSTTSARVRKLPSKRSLTSRRRTVLLAKLLLPVFALLLLATLALWPQISALFDNARITYRRGGLSADVQTGHLVNLRYHGLDARNRPYTVTADQAVQVGPERINLTEPKGDVVSENGSWTYAQSQQGVYRQHDGLLDLSGNVVLYRDNGVTLYTQSTSMDLKQGAAVGNEPTHVEGPFGTLDSQGFALVDRGTVMQFNGKSHLLLNGTHH